MKSRKMFIRIVAALMAVLMAGGIAFMVVQAFM